MDKTYVPADTLEASTYIGHRDNRAKYAYHHGAALARDILDRLLPALPDEDGDWLYDRIFELHMTLYSATLFELHAASAKQSFSKDDWYSNGWPILWREEPAADAGSQPLYEDIGEHPGDAVWMISPPNLAWVSREDAAKIVEASHLADAPPATGSFCSICT